MYCIYICYAYSLDQAHEINTEYLVTLILTLWHEMTLTRTQTYFHIIHKHVLLLTEMSAQYSCHRFFYACWCLSTKQTIFYLAQLTSICTLLWYSCLTFVSKILHHVQDTIIFNMRFQWNVKVIKMVVMNFLANHDSIWWHTCTCSLYLFFKINTVLRSTYFSHAYTFVTLYH